MAYTLLAGTFLFSPASLPLASTYLFQVISISLSGMTPLPCHPAGRIYINTANITLYCHPTIPSTQKEKNQPTSYLVTRCIDLPIQVSQHSLQHSTPVTGTSKWKKGKKKQAKRHDTKYIHPLPLPGQPRGVA